ncbi:acyl-CoA carboxylase subunit beta [Desulfosoma sp.]|uniref:acyl-CoA carboxylase subunit beta n=1 Tax=Desulfosoma sp. TaxID=2603217 RepID=UPI004049B7A7
MAPEWKELTEKLDAERQRLRAGGGAELQAKEHTKGKLTARERIELLFDPGTFEEVDLFAKHIGRDYGLDKRELPADGVIIGYGEVNGRGCMVYAEDFTVVAGTFGERHGRKICKIIDMARKYGYPVVGINDSGGARVTEQMGALSQYGQLFYRHVAASGVVPQIALIMGPVAGGQAYSPALMDFIFMVDKTSSMFIAGPPLVEAVVYEKTDEQSLGGPKVHGRITGVSDGTMADDRQCLEQTRRLLSYLPLNNKDLPPYEMPEDSPDRETAELEEIIPTDQKKLYNMRRVIEVVFDRGSFFELKKDFAQNLIIGFARLNGHVVGVVANNPMKYNGALDYNAADKGSRFVRFCDAFNIPLINLQDVPGFLIGTRSEYNGIIRHGAKMLYAYAEATVPKITCVVRKAYAGGYLAMCSKDLGADLVFALPTAEICLMGPQGAVNILFRKEIAAASDPEKVRAEREKEFMERYVNPTYAAGLQHVDDIILPAELRRRLIKGLEMTLDKDEEAPDRKHGITPV